METIAAFAHIVGAMVGLVAFWTIVRFFELWDNTKNLERFRGELSARFGGNIGTAGSEERDRKTLAYHYEKFNPELLRNRLSDFCGIIRTGWGWLGHGAEVAVLLGVIWFTFSESTQYAVYAWAIVAIDIVFWVVAVLFSLSCRLVTGRVPGEAKEARKKTAEWLRDHGASYGDKIS